MRFNSHTDFPRALLDLREQGEVCEWGLYTIQRTNKSTNTIKLKRLNEKVRCHVWVRVTLVFSTASSILSTMAESSTCRSHDALLMELTGWLFNQEVISATFWALWKVHQYQGSLINTAQVQWIHKIESLQYVDRTFYQQNNYYYYFLDYLQILR